MATSIPPFPPTTITPTVQDGDRAANAGHWSEAIAVWGQQLSGPERDAATQRIRWFLAESPGGRPVRDAPAGVPQRTLFLAGVAFGIAGTACVLVGVDQDGNFQNALAVAAWVLYVLTAILAVFYARRSGQREAGNHTLLSPADLQRATTLAALVDGHQHPQSTAA
jgi:amino acid transporter